MFKTDNEWSKNFVIGNKGLPTSSFQGYFITKREKREQEFQVNNSRKLNTTYLRELITKNSFSAKSTYLIEIRS